MSSSPQFQTSPSTASSPEAAATATTAEPPPQALSLIPTKMRKLVSNLDGEGDNDRSDSDSESDDVVADRSSELSLSIETSTLLQSRARHESSPQGAGERKKKRSDQRQSSTTTPSNATGREKTICAVCKVESDNHHIHYGALACFSCRAFFRRAHNRGSDCPGPDYVCKREGRCDITSKNRKKCQKCRYDRCIDVGMRPSLVLTDEQKKVRFRKMIEKKGAMAFRRKRGSVGEHGSDEDESDQVAGSGSSSNNQVRPRPRTRRKKSAATTSSATVPTTSSMTSTRPRTTSPIPSTSKTALSVTHSEQLVIKDEDDIKKEILQEFGIGDDEDHLTEHSVDPFQFQSTSFQQYQEHHYPQQSNFQLGPSFLHDLHYPQPGNQLHHQQVHYPSNHQPEQQQQRHIQCDLKSSVSTLRTMLDMATATTMSNLCNPLQDETRPLPNTSAPIISQQQSQNLNFVQQVLEAYSYAVSTVTLDKDMESRLARFHLGDTSALERVQGSNSTSDLSRVMKVSEEQFRVFAAQVHSFKALSPGDQLRLLKLNAPTYAQYILARYLSAPDGAAQLHWLLGQDMPEILLTLSVSRTARATVMSGSGLFRPSTDLVAYDNLTAQVAHLGLAQGKTAMVAALLLFSQGDDNLGLDSAADVQKLYDCLLSELSDGFPDATLNKERLEKLVDLMVVVRQFHRENCPLEEEEKDSPQEVQNSRIVTMPKELEMPYTSEEEAWLKLQLANFEQAYQEVSFGEDLINEFIMFSYDVPLSRHFIPSEIAAFVERMRRVLAAHSEFSSLSDNDQTEVFQENAHKAAALCAIKAEAHDTGAEQLQFCLGAEDRRDHAERLSSPQVRQIKKVLLSDWNHTAHALDTSSLLDYLRLAGNLTSAIKDAETFQLVALTALFSGRAAAQRAALTRLAAKYDAIIRRRSNSHATGRRRDEYFKIRTGMESVDELAVIFQKLQAF